MDSLHKIVDINTQLIMKLSDVIFDDCVKELGNGKNNKFFDYESLEYVIDSQIISTQLFGIITQEVTRTDSTELLPEEYNVVITCDLDVTLLDDESNILYEFFINRKNEI